MVAPTSSATLKINIDIDIIIRDVVVIIAALDSIRDETKFDAYLRIGILKIIAITHNQKLSVNAQDSTISAVCLAASPNNELKKIESRPKSSK